ncbi:MAG: DNA mismatch repair endonuclease MutL [Verrucomicrobiales bacterium]|jgi:DNA mismatch repair protein MutL|nr:DNA mismatch repair endonuclease MutL [Verrucomicrobiales bacterium]
MPNRVHLLDETVANRIAAGEVIERPASVVKELVENALDARAKNIRVEIERGGKGLIRVSDDGWGMSYDDALLALERHATSKIRSADDLTRIGTLGFRGEALPSIASVGKFRLVTREPESLGGTEVLIDGGKLTSVSEAGGAAGTQIEVRSLFFHVPGRRKFLRSDVTERAHIEQTLRLAALARPDVGFDFLAEGQPLARYPAAPDLRERLRQIFGARWLGLMLPVSASEGAYALTGFIGQPGVSRADRHEHHLFVNQRPVQTPTLNFAMLEGYHNSLMRGRFPVAVLFFQLDPARLDVNVHPAKREVRFRDNFEVRGFVSRAVAGALRQHGGNPVSVSVGAAEEMFARSRAAAQPPSLENSASQRLSANISTSPPAPRQTDFITPPASAPLISAVIKVEKGAGVEVPLEKNHDLRILGVLLGLYLIAENDGGIVLIDQHAAHERVLFEQMLDRMSKEEVLSQRLLTPLTVELDPGQADFVRQQLAALQLAGLGVDHLGGNTFVIDALPPMIKTQRVEQFFRDMVSDLEQAGGETRRQRRLSEEIIAKTVCRHAVKANDTLGLAEMEKLVVDLYNCALPYTCPHGRPTMIYLGREELEKKFGRVM